MSTDKDILLDVVALCESDGVGTWPASLGWTPGADLCEEWLGVTCDPTGRHVTRVMLPVPASPADAVECNASLLAGADWSDLTFLSLMSFSGHSLHGALPAQMLEPPNLLCVRARRRQMSRSTIERASAKARAPNDPALHASHLEKFSLSSPLPVRTRAPNTAR